MMIDQIKISGDSFKRYFKKASISLFLMSLLGVGLAYILSPFIVKIWGENFSGSVDSLRILSLGFPIYFLTALFMWTLVTLKKYKAMALIYGVGLIFNILGNLIFIPHYSYLASSWLTVASELLILILQVFILRQWIW